MNKLTQRPQYFFFLLALIMLFSGFMNKSSILKIDMGGYFLDLNIWTTCLFSTLFFIMVGVNYTSLTITNKSPKRLLTILHILFQLLALVPFIYIIFVAKYLNAVEDINQVNLILILSFGVFVVATFIHLINFFASLMSKKE